MTVFVLLFCISGIILNHRHTFSRYSVSRSLMPSGYTIRDFNNGIIKGSVPYGTDSVMAYGNSGIWLTSGCFSGCRPFSEGLPEGIDNRNIRNIVRTSDGTYWCAAYSGLFRLRGNRWEPVTLPDLDGRLSDVALTPDSASVVAMSRSYVYLPDSGGFIRRQIAAADEDAPKVSLFKTVWNLHSGALFGTVGRLIVDAVAVVLIVLCITGIVVFILPYPIRRSVGDRAKTLARHLKWNLSWHGRIGYWTIVLTVLVAATGMCLRPPLMIPMVLVKTSPLPGSAMDSDNHWDDRLRALRFDSATGRWLVSTSEGFMYCDSAFENRPVMVLAQEAPPVSPMGINVFESVAPGQWLVGSFSGLFRWDAAESTVTDFFSGEPYVRGGRRPVAAHMVAGYSLDFVDGSPVTFDYSIGTSDLAPMPDELSRQPMSLWNFALELHVGRCYTPFLGPLSDLFVSLSGLLLTLILISGLIIDCRIRHNITRNKSVTRQ